jgi:hypothetical protein
MRICSVGTERVNAKQRPISHKLYFTTHNNFIEFCKRQTEIIPFTCLLYDMTQMCNKYETFQVKLNKYLSILLYKS